MRAFVVCAFVLGIGGCGQDEDEIRRIVRDEMASAMSRHAVAPTRVAGPYSPAVRVGGFLFVSGQIGLDESGQLRAGSIAEETRQSLDNLNRILRSEGYDSSHVISATVYLRRMDDYADMNLAYGGYFEEGNYPSRVTVGVSSLPRQANVEIAAVAYKSDAGAR